MLTKGIYGHFSNDELEVDKVFSECVNLNLDDEPIARLSSFDLYTGINNGKILNIEHYDKWCYIVDLENKTCSINKLVYYDETDYELEDYGNVDIDIVKLEEFLNIKGMI